MYDFQLNAAVRKLTEMNNVEEVKLRREHSLTDLSLVVVKALNLTQREDEKKRLAKQIRDEFQRRGHAKQAENRAKRKSAKELLRRIAS
jgi:predicted GTPase